MRKEKQVACPEPGSVRSNRRKAILTGVLALTLMFSAAGGLTGYWYYQNAKHHVTVSFETNGGSAVRSVTLDKGTTLPQVPCTSKENSSFSGWYYDEQLTRPYSSGDAIEVNTKLYAAYGETGNRDQVYESKSAYLPDCGASAPLVIHADTEITPENLSDYLTVQSDLGTLPDAFVVDPLGDGNYQITPKQDYQAGCVYDFSVSNGATIVTEDSASLTSLSQRIHKDEIEVVELQQSIIYLDWDAVIRDGSDYQLYIPKSDTYTLSADSAFCLLEGYAEWVSAGENPDTFGQLFDDSALFLTAVSVQDDFADRTLDERMLSGDTWYYVEAQDGELEDVLDTVDVYTNMEVSAKELLDTKELEQSISQSAGASQLADLLTCAVLENERFQKLTGEAGSAEDFALFSSMTASAADYAKNPLMFRDGLSMGNAKGISVPAGNTGITVSVSWSRDSAQNPNFPGVDASDPDNNKWSALRVIIGIQREIKGVAVQASVDVTEYLKVTMQGYKEWDGSKVNFDYAANMYSQTNFDFYVQIRTEGSDSWEDISESVNDSISSSDMLAKYQKMINADGGYIDLCDVEIIGKDFYVIPEFPIFTVHLGLNYVLKLDLSAGLSSNFTYLDATQVGMRGKTGEGLHSYKNELVGANRYAYNLDACGYLGVKTGLKGELTLSFTGFRKLGEVGIALELGAYVDLYGYMSLEITKPLQYSSNVNKSFAGGYYMEMGIYLEVTLLARSQVFDAEAGLTLFEEKWPLYATGNRYILYSVDDTSNREYFMHANSADILDISGLSTTCLDLKTGALTNDVPLGEIGDFVAHVSDTTFQYSNMKLSIDGKNSELKARTATVDLYCSMPMLSMAATHAVEGYICISTQLYWADPSLNVTSIADFTKTPKATYCLKFPDGSTKEVAVMQTQLGKSVGQFGLNNLSLDKIYQMEDALYTEENASVASLKNNDKELYDVYISKDTVFYRNAERKQFYVSFVYYDGLEKCWKSDLRLCGAGEEPVPPEAALHTNVLTGWTGHDNLTGEDLTQLTKLSDDQYAYDRYRWSTIGQDQSQSIKTYRGSEQWQVTNDIEDYFNTGTSKPNRELTFTQTYVAQYRDCTVTFLYGTEEERMASAVTVPFDTTLLSPTDSTFVDSAGVLLGWDYNGDGAIDTEKNSAGTIILPRITIDGMVFYGVYEQPNVTIHVQQYDVDQACYVDSATFQVKNNQNFTFNGEEVLLEGEPVILDGETVDCFTKALDAVGDSDAAIFTGWEKRFRFASSWSAVNSTEGMHAYYQEFYLRPGYNFKLNLTFLPADGTAFTATVDGTEQQLTSHSVSLYQGDMYGWWNDFKYSVWSGSEDEVTRFIGWDRNGDGVVDYSNIQFIMPNKSMTLRAVCKTEKILITTRIQSPIALAFPEQIVSCITDNSAEGTYAYVFNGAYSQYQVLDDYISNLPETSRYLDEETGYQVFYHRFTGYKTSFDYYPNGKAVSIPVYSEMTIRQVHVGHTVTFRAGENGYFNQNDGSTVTEFTRTLDNGTYQISDFVSGYSTSPRRPSVGTSDFSVDYWMDEDGNRIENDAFIVSKQGRVLTAHWISETNVNLKSGDVKYGNFFAGSGVLANPRMRLTEGTHKFSELTKPVQSYYPDKCRYEVVGWTDSRDTEEIVHGLDEEFTITAGETPTFTARWELTGLVVRFETSVAFKSGTGEALVPGHDFNENPIVMLPVGNYKISDFPVVENWIGGSQEWCCVGWRDQNDKEYKFDDPDAVIALDTFAVTLTPIWAGTKATVSFNANGGIFLGNTKYMRLMYTVGDLNEADMPLPTRSNTEYESCVFAGWKFKKYDSQQETIVPIGGVFHLEDTYYYADAIWNAVELKHNYSYGYDETQHWAICENESCADPIGAKEPHTVGADGICTVCGYGCVTPPLRNGVYEISNLAELLGFAKLVNTGETGANAILTSDIVINRNMLNQNGELNRKNPITWTPIGTAGAYTGIFDGQGHTISGVYATNNGTNGNNQYLGLFCEIQNAEIKNLTLADSCFVADSTCMYLAGIVGHATDSTISCVENRAILMGKRIGGICVQADNCQILNCVNVGKIFSLSRASGIAAYVSGNGSTVNCYQGGEMSLSEAVLLHAVAENAVNCYYNTTITGIDAETGDEPGQTGKDDNAVRSGEVAYLLAQGENGAVWGQTIGEDSYPRLRGAVVYQNGSVYANGAAKLEGTSLSLNGTIGVHFYVSLSDVVTEDADAYMELTLPNGTTQQILVSDADMKQVDSKEYYVFSCGVAAKEMTRQIHAQIRKSDGTLMGAYAYSVEDYANYILDDANGFEQNTKDLALAMLNYGDFAEAYFSGKTLEETTEMAAVTAGKLAGYTRIESGTLPAGVTYYGSTLVLESGMILRHYFLVEPGTDVSAYGFTGNKDHYYYMDLSAVPGTATGACVIGGYTLSYDPMCYVRAVLTSQKSTDSLKLVAKALYLYHQAAEAYQQA